MDGKHAIITDTFVTPGNVHDSQPYLARLTGRWSASAWPPPPLAWMRATTRRICKGLVERDLYGLIGYRRPNHQDGYFYKREYTYDPSREGMCARADSSLPIGQPIAWGIVNITPMPVIAGIAQHEPNAPGVRT